MSNNYFCFKQFAVVQDNASMKVGTDGVLLGAWCSCAGARRVLDVGTGTGLIAIMAAQRSEAQVAAVEIDSTACIDAITNIDNCPWADRIELFNLSVQEFAADCPDRFDLIVSNPPFFSNSLKAPSQGRALARHDDTLPVADLFGCAAQLLTDNGRLSVIIPVDRLADYDAEAARHHLTTVRRAMVRPNPALPFHRAMVEYGYGAALLTDETITIETDEHGIYSPEYISLTRDFYLKF